MTEKRIVYITDVCSSIFAGGDAPKKHFSFEQTEECCYPVFSNGESHNGLYGYTNTARVTEPSITVSARGTIGFTAIRLTPFTPIVRLISITPIQDIIDIDYLYYALSNYTPENTGTSIPQLTVPMIKKYKFRLPEKDEQKRAVKTLKQLDDILEKGKIQIQKLDELVKSRFVEMFGTVDNNAFDYPVVRLGDYAKLQGGFAFKSKDFVDNGIPLVQIGNVNKDYLDWEVINSVPNEYVDRYSEFSLRDGDLVMAMTRPIIKSLNSVKIAKVAKSDTPCLLNQRVGRFVLSSSLNRLFLETLCKSDDFKDYVERMSGNSLQPNISSKQVEDYLIILPPIELQNQFADFVAKVEQQKTIVQKSIDKLETLKKSLMQNYFG